MGTSPGRLAPCTATSTADCASFVAGLAGRARRRCGPPRDPPKPGTPLPQRGPLHCPCICCERRCCQSPYPRHLQSTSRATILCRSRSRRAEIKTRCASTSSGQCSLPRHTRGEWAPCRGVTSARVTPGPARDRKTRGLRGQNECHPGGNTRSPAKQVRGTNKKDPRQRVRSSGRASPGLA